MFRKKAKKEAKTEDLQEPLLEDTAYTRAMEARRKFEAAQAALEMSKKRFQRFLRRFLNFLGLGVFVLLLVGAVMLEQAESCRFPRYELEEEFRYRIDIESQKDVVFTRGTKIVYARAGQIDQLTLEQEYGTYKIIADPDPELDTIVFKVRNRARNKGLLKRMTKFSIDTEYREIYDDETKRFERKAYTDVLLYSSTSESSYGEVSCARSDIEVVIPTACLLDETKMKVNVTKGSIHSTGLAGGTFDTVTLMNDKGPISADGLSAYRANLNSSVGTITIANSTSHYLLLLIRGDGGLIDGKNLTMYPAPPSPESEAAKTLCRNVTRRMPGEGDRTWVELVCDNEEGNLTVDSKGAENGGFPAITLDRVTGGNIYHKIKVGHTFMRVMSCYDFAGSYKMLSAAGNAILKVMAPPPGAPILASGGSAPAPPGGRIGAADVRNAAFSTLLGKGVNPHDDFVSQANKMKMYKTGKICADNDAVFNSSKAVQIINAEAITTGDITLELEYPQLNEVKSAAHATHSLLSTMVLLLSWLLF